ncbi:Gluconate 2-dehydrogenase cytochrome c subunit precursor [Legionella pneumophila]|uniref:c-type cytochrome n=1 Tax=Legionella pneumophila TaxID=446 RepID=UPI0007709B49|nr:c-type cytochrome [Legionella pneumophila]MCZ4726491.1 c-type cytochrome [Legionella pneumophila]MDW8937898.1 c-type cytochrome [Legionella pneumophila]MDW8940189.1 c-type cytochrome [Legionella pneumophila]MDW8947338.1 c-type cytochrome [Legionella pneumophila]MDW8966040.1 c-type cytochrome [Legionella pneumophila]
MRKLLGSVAIILVLLTVFIGSIFYRINKTLAKLSVSYDEPVNFPKYPVLNLEGKSIQEVTQIQRGEYLVKAGDCITCHTNTLENGKSFAGGLPIQTPYGVIYATNITPDKKTGIGQWSDADFIKAMREGISPDNTYYYPAFPFLYFNKTSTEDLLAIKAYLNAIPAIEQPNRANEMIWPFGWRFIQLGWRILFFSPNNMGPYTINTRQSSEWNRGAYLVEGLGHCGMCHTPSYYLFNKNFVLAAPIRKYNLAGAYAVGYLAPNITHSALGDVPTKELMKTFTEHLSLSGGKVRGPMLEAVHNSLIHFSEADLLSIITYLKNVHSDSPPQPVLKNISLGETIYKQYCSVCHNIGVSGAPKLGDFISWSPLIKSGVDKLYEATMNGTSNMPAKGGCANCSKKDIEAAVNYIVEKSSAATQN